MARLIPPEAFAIKEFDEAGVLTATYVRFQKEKKTSETKEKDDEGNDKSVSVSVSRNGNEAGEAIRVIYPPSSKSIPQKLLDIFLPAGYPGSVSDDYMWYQVYDSLQAFSSSIAGLISSRAVLEGIGIGNPTTTPTTALLLSTLTSTLSRLATITFAHTLGTTLEPETKRYRLLADIFNDAAMLLDCLSPALPHPLMVICLCSSGVLRAGCGVFAGSAKASLSGHFAKGGNLGELNAKDSSQETVIELVGMLCGTLLIPHLTTPLPTYFTLLLLLSIHLFTNYLAVRSVHLRSLNRQRTNILFSGLISTAPAGHTHSIILNPNEVARCERIFERDGILRFHGQAVGWARIGCSLDVLLRECRSTYVSTSPDGGTETHLANLLRLFRLENYLLWLNPRTGRVTIVLKREATPLDQLKAWAQALLLAHITSASSTRFHSVRESNESEGGGAAGDVGGENCFAVLEASLEEISRVFEKYEGEIRRAGWDLNIAALETRSGMRVLCREEEGKKMQ